MNKTTKIIFLVALLLAVSACFAGYLWYLSHPAPTPWGEIILPKPTEKPITAEPVVSKDFPPGTPITEANFCGDIVKAEKVEIMGVDIVKRIGDISTSAVKKTSGGCQVLVPDKNIGVKIKPFGEVITLWDQDGKETKGDFIEATLYNLESFNGYEYSQSFVIDKMTGNIYDIGPYGYQLFGKIK